MRAFAPGKLLLSGAYAVLHGARAVVLAVSRGAEADTSVAPEHVSDEVRIALELENSAIRDPPREHAFPHVNVRAMFEGEKKIGVGASAAGLVSALGARALDRGEDVSQEDVRQRIFEHARASHAKAQHGGSGVDVAASVYGGALVYSIHESDAMISPVAFPESLVVEGFFSGASVSTQSMRARVDAFADKDPRAFERVMRPLMALSNAAADAFSRGETSDFVDALHASLVALAELGRAADAPIVLPSFAELAHLAQLDDAAFLGSGAGGGDVAIYVGFEPSTVKFRERARALGLHAFSFERDSLGLRGMY